MPTTQVNNDTRVPQRPYSEWKREVAHMLDGLPPVRYAAGIRRNAEESLRAGELSSRGYWYALAWADKIYWS